MSVGSRTGTTRPISSASTRQLLALLPVRWCLLRDSDASGAGEIEYDVLVDGNPREVRRTLVASGARAVRSWGRAPHRQYTWWDEVDARPIRLDLVDELGFGALRELRVDERDAVLDRVTVRDGWPRPNPSDEQWLAVLHGLLDRDRLRPRDIARLDPWVASADEGVALSLPESLRTAIDGSVRARDWAALEAQREELGAALAGRDQVATSMRRGWRSMMRRSTKLQRALLRPGRRIALLGPDGAGKSSTIEALIESNVVESSVYLGVAPAGRNQRSGIPGVALLRTVRRLWGAWLAATLRRRRGHSVALDRHPLEATIGPPTSKRSTRVRRWILAHALPHPELVVVLMAPAEVLHDRKREHTLEDVVARRMRYLELAQRHGYPVIDTTAETADVVAAIRRAILDAPNRRRLS